MGLFKVREESLVGVDIGSTAIRVIELDISNERHPKVLTFARTPVRGEIFSGNSISNPSALSDHIQALFESQSIEAEKVVAAVPGPAVFSKRIRVPFLSPSELRGHIEMEASNYIPQRIDDVHLDFHVLGETGKNQLDVLLIAVKREVTDSITEVFSLAGLDVAILDVENFAVQNLFEIVRPDLVSKTVALVHIGGRYATINICRGGESLFLGDVAVGGRSATESLMGESDSLSWDAAEELKIKASDSGDIEEKYRSSFSKTVESMCSDLNRQLTFFWNSVGSDAGIDNIIVSGSGGLLPHFCQDLSEKTGVPCEYLDPMTVVKCEDATLEKELKSRSHSLSVALGLGLRRLGDRTDLDYE